MNLYSSRQAAKVLAMSILGFAAATFQSFALAASASTSLGFYAITNSNPGAVSDGQANLKVEVIDLNTTQVQFKFSNTSSSSIADIYFDDGTLLGIASIADSGSGVAFSQGATPGNLPSANSASPAFSTTAGFSADSDSPVSQNGVSSGEWVAITFNLLSGQTYNHVLAALALPNGGGTGDLRIGIHVQSFASGGGSESFINTPVPEPETYGMLLAGLGFVGWAAKRRKS